MRTFEIADEEGDLGIVRMTPSNVEKFCADFDYFLEKGILLTGITVAEVIINDDAVVNGEQLSNNRRAAIWYVESTDDLTSFDVNFSVTTNDAQTLHYVVHYVVGAYG